MDFTGVGFKSIEQPLTVGSETSFTVDKSLSQDALNLDEVVVIGSSLRQSRKQLGNTVNTVNSKQLTNTGSGNLAAALQGKVPGAQITQTSGDPYGGISIRMRGTSTIKGSSEPLYVIDGVIVSNATTNVTNHNVVAGQAKLEQIDWLISTQMILRRSILFRVHLHQLFMDPGQVMVLY